MSSSPPRSSDSDATDAVESVATPSTTPASSARRSKARRKLRRRVSGTILLLAGLFMAGMIASLLTPKPQVATADVDNAALISAGKQLYETSCVTCHGANLQGVPDRGPSLLGVGDAAVYFQVSTGRMPAARGEAQALRKPPKFTTAQIDQLGAYIQGMGGGPSVIYEHNPDGSIKTENGVRVVAQDSLRGDNLAQGGELFRLNCASCHNFTGRGGALSGGKFAPTLSDVKEQQIYTAMLTGPQNMPKFSNRQLSVDEKKNIIGFIKYVTESKPQGGLGIGGFGPVSEGMVMWFVGVVAIVAAAMWMGSRA
ncbi:ubiquinol-cytochrome c reductase cytochrome c subunit QcrC [Gordonia polyisoprenivorans VH2]|uniref:Cytochrome bc1 complex cytochrome c subunit n=2 Tax=Gordonia polyisoprenivorans TaxID=84595 RepID=H6MSR6_GORPV|nr:MULTISPECIES: cytochrome c [Gordonia]AFA73834.1 ubiquinol-cytochrome c reductase cytochrome c subunit QcrC [Gordonia polyisoprenivorans VH2]MBE7194286.1 c-type cytochrome [Gordonia polyisoprenivorans]MDF3280265.1 cytochrome c [Gordonia sp. N1V]NKY03397.1 c-type cytochrome [Gordonia polyisoprenivorans]OPX14735.1 cytochrome C [Gordonia sp. i37]